MQLSLIPTWVPIPAQLIKVLSSHRWLSSQFSRALGALGIYGGGVYESKMYLRRLQSYQL